MCLFPCLHLLSFSRSSHRVSAQRMATALNTCGRLELPELSLSPLQRASAIFFLCSCSSTPGKRGTLITRCPGFFECWPQRRQFRPLTYRSAAPDPASAAALGCFHLSHGERPRISQWLSDLFVLEPFPPISAPGRLGIFIGNFTTFGSISFVPHTTFCHLQDAVATLLFLCTLERQKCLPIMIIEGQILYDAS